jgi:hypothetical protein
MLSFRESDADPCFTGFLRLERAPGSGHTEQTTLFPPDRPSSTDNPIANFCFPADVPLKAGTQFRFALTSRSSRPTYGYVRYVQLAEGVGAYCLLSSFFNASLYFSIIATYHARAASDPEAAAAYLAEQHRAPLSTAAADLYRHQQKIVKETIATVMTALPMQELSLVLSSMLISRRIIITSAHFDVIERFAFGLLAMLHPLAWPGVFIPILPEMALQAIYAPFHYIIGLHSSFLQATQSPEMESFLLVSLDDKKVQDFNPPFRKFPKPIQKSLKKFEKFVRNVGLGKVFQEFLLLLISTVLKADPHNPAALVAAFDANVARINQADSMSFETCLLGSQFVDELMCEARAGPGSIVHHAFWGEEDVQIAPSRPAIHASEPIAEQEPEAERLTNIEQICGQFLSRPSGSIDQMILRRKAARKVQMQGPPPPVLPANTPLGLKSRIAFFSRGPPPEEEPVIPPGALTPRARSVIVSSAARLGTVVVRAPP